MKHLSFATTAWYGLVHLLGHASAAKVISYPVTRVASQPDQVLAARAMSAPTAIPQLITNNISLGLYYVSVEVGTPAQTLQLALGLASSDVWVIDSSATACGPGASCLTPFDSASSQTLKPVGDASNTSEIFSISYVDGTYANGVYRDDVFAIGETHQFSMTLQLGLATNISSGFVTGGGNMGIGYRGNEATTETYLNFMDMMVKSQFTNTMLYSLWLNSHSSSTGSIPFGGVDTEKFYGTLYSMPIQQDADGLYSKFTVNLTSVSYAPTPGPTIPTIPITNSSFTIPIDFDASTTLIYLPRNTVQDIYTAFNVQFLTDTAYVDCKYSNSSYFSFGFESGSVINVAYSEVINKDSVSNSGPTGLPFTDLCTMGILSGDDYTSGVYALGDYFLRSAYAVFDLTNNRVGIAQSKANATKSNIVEVPAGAASIPQVTGVPSPSPSSNSSSGSTSATSSVPTHSATTASPPKSNHAVAIGVGVAVPIVVIGAALAGFFLCFRRRRQASAPDTQPEVFAGHYSVPPYSPGSAYMQDTKTPNHHSVVSDNGGMLPSSPHMS